MKQETIRNIIGGAAIGVLVAGGLSLPALLAPAFADEPPTRQLLEGPLDTIGQSAQQLLPAPFDGAALVKRPERFITEASVSTEPISHRTIRKIGYGRTTFVEVVTTATGTYSSDALASPHVLYPGIHPNPDYREAPQAGLVAMWDGGWVPLRLEDAHSFVNVVPFNGGAVLIEDSGEICARVGAALYC